MAGYWGQVSNGQFAYYQEALAQHYNCPAGPTCDDAENARQLGNELAHNCPGAQALRGGRSRKDVVTRFPWRTYAASATKGKPTSDYR